MRLRAEGMRALVRIKLADDNDLNAANSALSLCDEFFISLESLAARQQIQPFELFKELSSLCRADSGSRKRRPTM